MTELHRLGLAESGRAIREGSVASYGLVEALLERIKRLEPQLTAWVTIDREGSLAAASALDKELESSGSRGPLHGVPRWAERHLLHQRPEDHSLFPHYTRTSRRHSTPPVLHGLGKLAWWFWARL